MSGNCLLDLSQCSCESCNPDGKVPFCANSMLLSHAVAVDPGMFPRDVILLIEAFLNHKLLFSSY